MSYGTLLETQVACIARHLRDHCTHIAKHDPNDPNDPNDPLCVVLDIDETVVRNLECVRGTRPRDDPAPPIPETQPLRQVLDELGIAYAFVSSRGADLEEVTRADLERSGWGGYCRLILPETHLDSAADVAAFKHHARCQIARAYTIVATVGDQVTDLLGEPLGQPFLLYNPFYRVDPLTGDDATYSLQTHQFL